LSNIAALLRTEAICAKMPDKAVGGWRRRKNFMLLMIENNHRHPADSGSVFKFSKIKTRQAN
jgi:hypothetical protein